MLLVAVLALATACASTSQDTPAAGSAAPTSPPPRPSVVQPTPVDPCATAVAHVGAFVDQLGSRLAELRSGLTAQPFDSAATAARVAQVSATLTAFAGVEERAGRCTQTFGLAARITAVRAAAEAPITDSRTARVSDGEAQRAAGVELFGLLPEVVAIGRQISAVAASLGVDDQVAAIPDASTRPIGSLEPLPTPTPLPTAPPGGTYGSAFFGPGTTVKTYAVTGASPADIELSIGIHGPIDQWLPGRAEALTLARAVEDFELQPFNDDCRLVPTADPPVHFEFTITLPRWTAPEQPDPSTVAWWQHELARAATHEKHHVDLWRAAGARMATAVALSTCANVTSNLNAIVRATTRANCQFDLDEYGRALGLTLESCVHQ